MASPRDEPILVVVTAAGSSSRFGSHKKELAKIEAGESVLDRALSPFIDMPNLEALVITAPAGQEEELRAALSKATLSKVGKRLFIVAGGQSRRDSVLCGLETLAAIPNLMLAKAIVLVHDGARPWASSSLAERVAHATVERGAAIPVVPLVDTPKELGDGGTVLRHPSRTSLGAAQTPQGFQFCPFLAAQRQARIDGIDCTDDAEIWDRYVGPVAFIPGESENKKITYQSDLMKNSSSPHHIARSKNESIRIGQGWDLHRLVQGRKLMIGGIAVPNELGEEAHSDGDVLLHAAIDALLGAAALGDIGTHFPPTDEKWHNSDSRDLARRTSALVQANGWIPGNLDCTVILESPKLGPWREHIRGSLAECFNMPVGSISFKAKTKEGVDATGEGRAIEAYAIVTLFRA